MEINILRKMISQGQMFPFAELQGVKSSSEDTPQCRKIAKTNTENKGSNKDGSLLFDHSDTPNVVDTTAAETDKILSDTATANLDSMSETFVGKGGAVDKYAETVHPSVDDNERDNKSAEVDFWVNDPNVLLAPTYVYEIFPVATMTYNRKMNAISRLILLLVLISFALTHKTRVLWIGSVCLFAIYLIQYTQNRENATAKKEGFLDYLGVDDVAKNVVKAFATDDLDKIGQKQFFDVPKVSNPYNNVLITDIVDNPSKLPAPPAFYPETEKEILDKTKEAIQIMNPTFPNMTDKLFASLDDHFEFEQSARQFYTNPCTTIPNDQGAFAAFCYGEMLSCKEGNMFACARDAPRHNLY